jgi:hypothetical protein
VLVKDLLFGLQIEIPYGDKELDSDEFVTEYKLHLIYQDGSQKKRQFVDARILMR